MSAYFAFTCGVLKKGGAGRKPRVHIPSSLPYANDPRNHKDIKTADAAYVTPKVAKELVHDPSLLGSLPPFIVRGKPSEPQSFEHFIRRLKRSSSNRIDVQDATVSLKKDSARSIPITELIGYLQDASPPRTTISRPPYNLLDMSSTQENAKPSFLIGQPFDILSELVSTLRRRTKKTEGKDIWAEHFDLQGCIQFAIFGQRFCASLWHCDSGGTGTYLNCNYGRKLWPIIRQLTEDQRRAFQRDGDSWMPEAGTVPILLVGPGETIIMRPGWDNIHGPMTPEDCGMDGGMFWERRVMEAIAKKIIDQLKYPHISNEPLADQFPALIYYLRNEINAYPEEYTDHEKLDGLCTMILHLLSCVCGRS